MDIDKTSVISVGARLDKTNPRGIHIGKGSYVTSGALILAHDYSRSLYDDTFIGDYCFIGANAIIMPGVKIGNNVIVGSGAVVTKNIVSNCIIAGNPAKIIKENIVTTIYGKLI